MLNLCTFEVERTVQVEQEGSYLPALDDATPRCESPECLQQAAK